MYLYGAQKNIKIMSNLTNCSKYTLFIPQYRVLVELLIMANGGTL